MATTLSPSEMKDIVRRHFEDLVNNKKAEVIRQTMTEDFLDHDGPGGKETGVQGDEDMMRNMYRIMPDLHIDIDEMIADWRFRIAVSRFASSSCALIFPTPGSMPRMPDRLPILPICRSWLA